MTMKATIITMVTTIMMKILKGKKYLLPSHFLSWESVPLGRAGEGSGVRLLGVSLLIFMLVACS